MYSSSEAVHRRQSTPPSPKRGSSRSTGGRRARGVISPSNGNVSHPRPAASAGVLDALVQLFGCLRHGSAMLLRVEWPESFYELKRGEGCPMCAQGRPEETEYGVRILAGEVSDAYLQKAGVQRGYSIVIWRGRHVAEPTELDPEEAAAYWRELLRVGRALEERFEPVKLNYELLGNSLPHLHTHVMPRYDGRPEAGLAVPASRGRARAASGGRAAGGRRGSPRLARLTSLEGDGRPLGLQQADTGLVRELVRRADSRSGAGLAGDRERRAHADPGADGLREDARRVPVRDRQADRLPGRGAPPALRLAAEGAQLRRRAQPPRPARRARLEAERRRPHRRHAAARPRGDAPRAPGHPDHDPGVALPPAHVARRGRC